jgi:hypothetical protein
MFFQLVVSVALVLIGVSIFIIGRSIKKNLKPLPAGYVVTCRKSPA